MGIPRAPWVLCLRIARACTGYVYRELNGLSKAGGCHENERHATNEGKCNNESENAKLALTTILASTIARLLVTSTVLQYV